MWSAAQITDNMFLVFLLHVSPKSVNLCILPGSFFLAALNKSRQSFRTSLCKPDCRAGILQNSMCRQLTFASLWFGSLSRMFTEWLLLTQTCKVEEESMSATEVPWQWLQTIWDRVVYYCSILNCVHCRSEEHEIEQESDERRGESNSNSSVDILGMIWDRQVDLCVMTHTHYWDSSR